MLGCGRPETDLEGVCVADLGRTASDEAVELRAVAGEGELWLAAGPLAQARVALRRAALLHEAALTARLLAGESLDEVVG